MTREEMVDLFVHWFSLNHFTRFTALPADSEYHEFHPWPDIDILKEQWLAEAPVEWFAIALDIATHPPNLTKWNFDSSNPVVWNADEEFLIEITAFLGVWYRYAPAVWLREMTPYLNNEITLSVNARHSTAREMALAVAKSAGLDWEEFDIGQVNQLIYSVEPLGEQWHELNENEQFQLSNTLTLLYRWYPRSDARRVLLKLKPIVGEPYQEWIIDELERERLKMEKYEKFAQDWIEAWNAHDLEAILSHYAEGVQYQSPFVTQLGGNPQGTLRGIEIVRAYVKRALEAFPNLHFVLLGVYGGVDSVVLHYRSVNDLTAAEFFQFDLQNKIVHITAHYSPASVG